MGSRLAETLERHRADRQETARTAWVSNALHAFGQVATALDNKAMRTASAVVSAVRSIKDECFPSPTKGEVTLEWMIERGFVDEADFPWFTETDARSAERVYPVLEQSCAADDDEEAKAKQGPPTPIQAAMFVTKPVKPGRVTIHDIGGVKVAIRRRSTASVSGVTVAWQDGGTKLTTQAALAAMVFMSHASDVGVRIATAAGRTRLTPLRVVERDVLSESEQAMLERIRSFQAHGLSRSIVLYGAPGVGKTTRAYSIAKALHPQGRMVVVDHSADGQAIMAAQAFVASGMCSAILFDDIDRAEDRHRTAALSALSDMHGKVLVFVTANALERLDPASLRSQRCDELVYVPAPSRQEVGRTLLSLIDADKVDAVATAWRSGLAAHTTGWSYADVHNLAQRLNVLGADSWPSEVAAINVQRGFSTEEKTRAYLMAGRSSGMTGEAIPAPSPPEDPHD